MAALNGDVASIIWLQRGEPDPITHAAHLTLMEQVVAADDPTAMLYLGDMRHEAGGDEAVDFTRGEVAGHAWQIAACRRGLDCAAGSALMDQFCMAGMCAPSDLEAYIRAEVARQGGEVDQMDAAVDSILALFPTPPRQHRR